MHLKDALRKDNIVHQLVPPHAHCTNLAERTIQTVKNHFKSGLALIDPNFPLVQWHRLLEQDQMALNILYSARVNPNILAYTYLFGEFDFNTTPLAPPGIRVVLHTNPAGWGTWQPNDDNAWYVDTSMEHYHCVNCYFPDTRATCDVDIITFFSSIIPIPKVKIEDFLRQAATYIFS